MVCEFRLPDGKIRNLHIKLRDVLVNGIEASPLGPFPEHERLSEDPLNDVCGKNGSFD